MKGVYLVFYMAFKIFYWFLGMKRLALELGDLCGIVFPGKASGCV